MRVPRWWPIAVFLGAGFAAALTRVISYDTPWLLRAGEEILARRGLPATDPFSYTSAQAWLNHEWLAEVLLALAHRAGGFVALGLLKAGLVAATLGALAWAAGRGALAGLAPLAWAGAAIVLREIAEPRAQLFSYVLFALTLALCLRDLERPSRRLWLALPLGLLWTQLHGGNPTGVALFGALFVASPDRRRAAALAAAALMTCAGPHGWRVHGHFLGARDALPALREWQPLATAIADGSLPHLFALALLGGAAATLVARGRRGDPMRFEAVALVVFTAVAARYVRFAAEASLVAAVILARGLARLELRGRVAALARHAALPAALALLLGAAALSPRPLGFGLDPGRFPVGAVAWLRAHRPPGPMFNAYNFGGYLLWAYPEERVFIDGRAFTVYSNEHLRELVDVYRDPDRFAALEARWGFRLAVLHVGGRGTALLAWLRERPGWRLAYLDGRAAVFVRDPVH